MGRTCHAALLPQFADLPCATTWARTASETTAICDQSGRIPSSTITSRRDRPRKLASSAAIVRRSAFCSSRGSTRTSRRSRSDSVSDFVSLRLHKSWYSRVCSNGNSVCSRARNSVSRFGRREMRFTSYQRSTIVHARSVSTGTPMSRACLCENCSRSSGKVMDTDIALLRFIIRG